MGGERKRKKGESWYKRKPYGRDGPKSCVHPEEWLFSASAGGKPTLCGLELRVDTPSLLIKRYQASYKNVYTRSRVSNQTTYSLQGWDLFCLKDFGEEKEGECRLKEACTPCSDALGPWVEAGL